MKEPSFTLNGRFVVKPSFGLIRDDHTGQETRVEPRLMNLLCLLAKHNGQLVARQVITKQIWDDYGNADEGLTQAISYLRKVLNDKDKQLIETVPKNGYVLHARVSYDELQNGPAKMPGLKRKRYMLAAGVLFILIIVAVFVFKSKQSQKQHNPDMLPATQNPVNPDAVRPGHRTDVLPDSQVKNKSGGDKAHR